MQSNHVRVQVDLNRVRRNTADVAARVGVPILATIKADAYGLGARAVARDNWSLKNWRFGMPVSGSNWAR